MPKEAVVEIKGLCKNYGQTKALIDLDLVVPRGRIFGIIGPNGAGKTTLLRILMNLVPKTSGDVRVFGLDVEKNYKEIRRKTGYLPEDRGLYEDMRVDQMLSFFAKIFQIEDPGKKMDALLKRTGLLEKKHEKVGSLSKGMKQKLSLVRTLLHDPELIILDEPTMGLDPLATKELTKMIVEEKNKGKTVLFSTHILNIAEKICDDVLVLNKGRKVAEGKIPELRKKSGKKKAELEEIFVELVKEK